MSAPQKTRLDDLAERLAKAKPVPAIPNVHPADELCALREEKAIIDKRIDELRDQLLAEGADLNGDQVIAVIQPGTRETLDKKALIEAYGEKAIAPYIKKTEFRTVKLVEKK